MSLERETRQTCLVVSIEAPWPAISGGRARTSQIINQLAATYDVTVLYPAAQGEQVPDAPQGVTLVAVTAAMKPTVLDRLGTMPRLGKLALRALGGDLARVLKHIDPALVYWTHSYLAAAGMRITLGRLNVVEFANIEGARSLSIFKSSTRLPNKMSAWLEYVKSIFWEPRCAREASLVVSLHETEAVTLRQYGAEVILVPNGFSHRDFSPSATASRRILTMGSWTYEPNRKGLESFLKNDWPKILRLDPRLELVIAGKGSDDLLGSRLTDQSNISILGFVEDLSSIFQDSFCFLAPATTGGGSQLKVAEALSHHRVVVGPKFLEREVFPGLPDNAVIGTEDLPRTIFDLSHAPEVRHELENQLRTFVSDRTWQRNFAPVRKWLVQTNSLSSVEGTKGIDQ